MAKLDQKTGDVQEFNVPQGTRGALHVHSVLQAPDGIVGFPRMRGARSGNSISRRRSSLYIRPHSALRRTRRENRTRHELDWTGKHELDSSRWLRVYMGSWIHPVVL